MVGDWRVPSETQGWGVDSSRVRYTSIFVQIEKCICPNLNIYLSKFQNVFVKFEYIFVQIEICICQNLNIYLSKLQNVFVKNLIFICPNLKLYLSKFEYIFVQINSSSIHLPIFQGSSSHLDDRLLFAGQYLFMIFTQPNVTIMSQYLIQLLLDQQCYSGSLSQGNSRCPSL